MPKDKRVITRAALGKLLGPTHLAVWGLLASIAGVLALIISLLPDSNDQRLGGSSKSPTSAIQGTSPGLSEASSAALPFAISVDLDPSVTQFGVSISGPSWLFQKGAAQTLPKPDDPPCQDWHSWARRHGGVDSGRTYVSIGVSAVRQATVQLVGADLEKRELPRREGDLVECQAGGETTISHLTIDLDKGTADFVYPVQVGNIATFAPRPLALNIEYNKPERIDVVAGAGTCFCAWSLNLHLRVEGREYVYKVDDHGSDFVTLPGSDQPHFEFDGSAWTCYYACR